MNVRLLLIHGEARARKMAEENKDRYVAAQFYELASLFNLLLTASNDFRG